MHFFEDAGGIVFKMGVTGNLENLDPCADPSRTGTVLLIVPVNAETTRPSQAFDFRNCCKAVSARACCRG